MRILILSSESWNDIVHGNNMLSGWFTGIDAELANIYASPEQPYNSTCNLYFQVTDMMMYKSLISNKKAGRKLYINNDGLNNKSIKSDNKNTEAKYYSFFKSLSGPFIRLLRELLWKFGRYNKNELKSFIDEFNPDIIFTERMASCKMLRLEKIVKELSPAPMVAFTGDDEYSLHRISFSPFYWINRLMIRKSLRHNVKFYSLYYMLSSEQKEYYEKIFGCKCKLLYKCAEATPLTERNNNGVIKIIYAGKFYCNRWKMLADIADVIREINKDSLKVELHIYTADVPNKKQNMLLNDGKNSTIHKPVSQEKLKVLYGKHDIALHVESTDIRNRLSTRFSFSTKIIDCLFSGCAVMAYCWEKHSGLTYLRNNDCALCATNKQEMKSLLEKVTQNRQIISEYAEKAHNLALEKHQRQVVQKELLDDFAAICNGRESI